MIIYKLEIITNYMQTHKLSKYKLCKLANISLSSLNNIFNQKNIRLKTLYKLRIFLGQSFLEI